jgi:hypothetical protein
MIRALVEVVKNIKDAVAYLNKEFVCEWMFLIT